MALIQCPECNAQVSDTAPVCPKCGYNISHYCAVEAEWKRLKDNQKLQHYLDEQKLNNEMEKIEVPSSPPKAKPYSFANIASIVVGILCIVLFTSFDEVSDEPFMMAVVFIIGGLFIGLGFYSMHKDTEDIEVKKKIYEEAQGNPEKYKENIARRNLFGESGYRTEFSDEVLREMAEYTVEAHENRSVVHCPYCQSTNTQRIGVVGRSVSAATFGLASSKIGKQWHCNKCGSDF